MNNWFTPGRLLLAVAVLSLGIEHLIRGNFPAGLLPFPAAFPGRFVIALTLGIAFSVAGVCIASQWKARLAALGLGVLLLLLVLYPHVPIVARNLYNGGAWTAIFELIGLSGGAFYLAGVLKDPLSVGPASRFSWVVAGRLLFAASLVIFAVLHFVYAAYIATLIPSWIPVRLFWAYFVGVAFAGTAVSLLLNWQRRLATTLLGVMFLLWVVVLHAPRALANPQREPEWTSLFVAMAMGGIAFIIAGSSDRR